MKKQKNTIFEEYLKLFVESKFLPLKTKERLRFEMLEKELSDLRFEELRNAHRGLNKSLRTIEDYVEKIQNPPFCGDLGVGTDKCMRPRWESRGFILEAHWQLMETLMTAYAKLILTFVSESHRQAVNALELPSLDPVLRKKYPEFYWLLEHPDVWERFLSMLKNAKTDMMTPDDIFSHDLSTVSADDSLNVDSLDMCEFSMIAEDELGIKPEKFFEMETTYGGLAKLIKSIEKRLR